MKKLFTMLALGLVLTSCSDTPIKVQNPKTETTIELQQLAKIDSTTYKVVEKGNEVYILSTEDNMVVKEIRNYSGLVDTALLLIVLLFILVFIILIIGSNS